jgi:pimeloyl-ACP methyl ester carboxylesterase
VSYVHASRRIPRGELEAIAGPQWTDAGLYDHFGSQAASLFSHEIDRSDVGHPFGVRFELGNVVPSLADGGRNDHGNGHSGHVEIVPGRESPEIGFQFLPTVERGDVSRFWVLRALRWLAFVAIIGVIALLVSQTWKFSDEIRRELLTPPTAVAGSGVEVLAVGRGTIVLPATDQTAASGTYPVRWDGGNGEIGPILENDGAQITRTFTVVGGDLAVGTKVEIGGAVGDTPQDIGIAYTDVVIESELGPLPAWHVEGQDDTWIIYAHDFGSGARSDSLDVLPALVAQGFPVIVPTMRNDLGAPSSEDGLVHWGFEEWMDLESALIYARANGAEDVVLIGKGMGAQSAALLVQESREVRRVVGLILDSPTLDLTEVEKMRSMDSSTPSFIRSWGRSLASARFGVEWARLDQLSQIDRFRAPILMLHGSADAVAPVAVSDAFAEALPDIVTYVRILDGTHGALSNTDSERYDQAVRDFLTAVAAGPASSAPAP